MRGRPRCRSLTRSALRQAIDSYIAQGYAVGTQDTSSATMVKKKEFQVLWAVIGFFLCLLPLLIYCIVYATQSDEVVRVVVGGGATQLQVSADGNWWWSATAQRWVGVLEQLPPQTPISDDRQWWWDGAPWRRLPSPSDHDHDGQITTTDASAMPAGLPSPANSET